MNQIILQWNKVPNATGYILKYNEPSTGNITIDLGDVDSFTLNDLEEETYDWSVTPYNDIGEAVDIPVWNFTVDLLDEPPAPISTIGNIVTSEQTFIIPVTAKNFEDVSSANLLMNYNPEIIIAEKVEVSPELGGNLTVNLATDGLISLGWYTSQALTLPDDVILFNITFTSISEGSTRISFDNDSQADYCKWYNVELEKLSDTPTEEYYINGNVTVEDLIIITEPPIVTTLIYPEDGSIIEIEEDPIGLLPAILRSPPLNYEINAGTYPQMNLYWDVDELSSPNLGCYFSAKENGVLIIEEDIPNGGTIPNHYAISIQPNSSYEWQVIPYNEEEEVENCPWWNFSTSNQTQTKEPDTTIGGVSSKQPTFDLPVTVKLFKHINKFNLSITYNTTGDDVGTCTGVSPNPNLGGEITMEHIYFQNGKRIKISWVGTESKELPDDSVLFTLHFDHNPNLNKTGFSQVCWYNVILTDPNKDQCEWYNDDVLIDYSVGGHYQNGWINTTIENGEVPLPLNPVNMTPHQGGGTVYKFVEAEKTITINWMAGNPPRPIGWKMLVKEDGVIIHDKEEVTISKFSMVVKPDLDYEFQIIPFNEYGECGYNEWFTFKTETLIILDGPISTVGTIESDTSTTIVPITVKNFKNVGACDLKLTYDPGIVTFSHATTGDGVGYTFFIANGNTPGTISISWIIFNPGPTGAIGLDLPDNAVIFNLHFNKIANIIGTSEIAFDISNILYCNWYSAETEEFNDEPSEEFYINGSITQVGANIENPPESVGIRSPQENSVDVGSIIEGNLVTDLKWFSSDIASGYKLYLSDTETFGEAIDVGNVVLYTTELNYNTTYFWKIVPYNEIGDAINCPIHAFTTLESANINPITTLQSPSLVGDIYSLPVTVRNFYSVGAISLALNYDSDIIEYQSMSFNIHGMMGNDLGNQLRVAWFGNAVSLAPDEILFTIHFKLLPTPETETTFEWSDVNGECEYASDGGEIIYSNAIFQDLTWII